MTYILSEQRYCDDPTDAAKCWANYQAYLRTNKSAFPDGVYQLATSDWYYNFSDHGSPHDAWLEWAKFEEPATGARCENRHLSLRVRLLGAYHDYYLEFFYPAVYAYSLCNPLATGGHADWLYDEFRLSASGRVIHEIEWAGGARWLIEASDVQFARFSSDLPR